MTATDYLINAALILLVVRQIRERRVDIRSLILPVVLVYTIAGQYLHSIPTAGNDLVLVVGLASLGLILGSTSAFFHTMRVGSDGVALARAGWIAAGLWIAALVLMAVCEVAGRLAMLQLRAYRLTSAHADARLLAGASA
jgi:hypothetical protein